MNDIDGPKDSCFKAHDEHIITPLFMDTFVGFFCSQSTQMLFS